MASAVRVRLLGPVDITVDGVPRPVAGVRRRAVLATLALHAGRAVSTDRLIDAVWGDGAPATARNTLQRHLSYLRRDLGLRDTIVSEPSGYALRLGVRGTDLRYAETLVADAQRAGSPREKATTLAAALGLWRGAPLANLTGTWFDAETERLERLRLAVARALHDVRLELGEHRALVPVLEEFTRGHPLDEEFCAQLMVALYRSGRQADALEAYQRLRRTLADELGIEPDRRLRELEVSILRQDPSLDHADPTTPASPAATAPAAEAEGTAPAQLPHPAAGFVGRDAELSTLDGMLRQSAAMPVCAISGPPGVGKTTLAVHWAHRVADRFPDGQLYVNLRGFDAGGEVLDPNEAVRGFLLALGVPPDRVPAEPDARAELDARAALYRSLVAGRRMLVVLDNARDAGHVRPLLPGTPSCLTVVTSRTRLTPLVATDGATPLSVEPLSASQGRALLAARVGADRLDAEAGAAHEIVRRCAGLPLALAVLAARVATEPGLSLTALADALRAESGALDVLAAGDPATDLRAVFSWSYHALSPDAGQLFDLLGLHPGPDVTEAAAASLAGLPTDRVRPLLAELTRAQLVLPYRSGRYAIHDLLREYATERILGRTADAERRAATRRMLDHYLHTACAASRLYTPLRHQISPSPPAAGVRPEPLPDQEAAVAWFAAERAVVSAAVSRAYTEKFDRHAWQLAWAVTAYLDWSGHWDELAAVHRIALCAAVRLGDPRAQGHALRGLAFADRARGRHDDARRHFAAAIRVFGEAGDLLSTARLRLNLAILLEGAGDLPAALDQAEQSLALYRKLGDRGGVAHAQNCVGWMHALLGAYDTTLHYCGEALATLRELGQQDGLASTLDSLGYAHHQRGDHVQAISHYRMAVAAVRDLGDRSLEAAVLDHLGDALAAADQTPQARQAWQDSYAILEQLGHADASRVRAKLLLSESSRRRIRT